MNNLQQAAMQKQIADETELAALRAEVEKYQSVLRAWQSRAAKAEAEVEKLRAALGPFADMGGAMMGRKHHNEAVVQYALAPTIFVHHLISAHKVRAALEEPKA